MRKPDFKAPEIVRKPNGDYYVISPDAKHRLGPFDRNTGKFWCIKMTEQVKQVNDRYGDMVNQLFIEANKVLGKSDSPAESQASAKTALSDSPPSAPTAPVKKSYKKKEVNDSQKA